MYGMGFCPPLNIGPIILTIQIVCTMSQVQNITKEKEGKIPRVDHCPPLGFIIFYSIYYLLIY